MTTKLRIPYRPNSRKLIQLFVSGTVALLFSYVVQVFLSPIGIRVTDKAFLYGTLLFGSFEVPEFPQEWWLGLLFHAALCIFALPVLFDYCVHTLVLPASRWIKGIIFGALVWFVLELVLLPMSGIEEMVFTSRFAFARALGHLATWVAYGAVLDGFTRVRVTHALEVAKRKAA